MSVLSTIKAIRGAALSFVADPFLVEGKAAIHYEPDGLIIIERGKIKSFGNYGELKKTLPKNIKIKTYKDSLILPGFIDTHVHYPQIQIMGSFGKQLLDWLNNYTFVAEDQFGQIGYAKKIANFFLDECLRVGTTTMMTYCTVHEESVDAFFLAAKKRNMRVIAGKVLMDRNAPKNLLDKSAQKSYDQSLALINKWHNKGRFSYAITPRFAPTSTPLQLELAGSLLKKIPGTFLQSHIAENMEEVAWVKKLFPKSKDYVDVYDQFGLLGKHTVLGHGIHLSEREWQRLYEAKTSIAHCPTSNQFLGSGLFDLKMAKKENRPVKVGLATDVGAGTGLSQLQSMNEAYKIAQLNGFSLTAIQAFYLATRGAAESLGLEDKIGSIKKGMEADLVVLDLKSTELISFRMNHCKDIEEALFIQMIMGDDRATKAVYVNGNLAYENKDNK